MKSRTALDWGARFRLYLKDKGSSLAKVAERLGRAESTLRHWTNGTRDINLAEFLELCGAAGIDPAMVLFAGQVDAKFLAIGQAWGQASPVEKEVLWIAARGILAQHESAGQRGGAEFSKSDQQRAGPRRRLS